MWRELLSELRRRRVPQVAVAYLIAAWVVIQVVATITDPLQLPPSSQTLVIVLAVLGLPVTLVVAWAFEITPEGVRRTRDREGVEGDVPPVRRSTQFMGVLIGSVLVLALGWGAWWLWIRTASTDTARASEVTTLDRNRVAVLYFDDYSPNHELGYLSGGLTETLIHELSAVNGLSVVPANGVKPYRNGSLSDDSIGRALRAGSVVGGSVQLSGDSLRVIVRLVDAATASEVSDTVIDVPNGDLFALQDSVSSQVARFLRRDLGEEIRLHRAKEGADDPEAWRLYETALALRDDADSLRISRDTTGAKGLYGRVDSLLSVVHDKDPAWTLPAVERGWTLLSMARTGATTVAQTDTTLLRRGVRQADRVLAEHHEDPAALELRGYLEWFLSQATAPTESEATLDSAQHDLDEATTRDPSRARAWLGLAYILRGRGRFDAMRVATQRAAEADPYLFNTADYSFLAASILLELGRLDEADKAYASAEQLYPHIPAYPQGRLIILASRPASPGSVDRAWAYLRKVEQLGPKKWQYGRMLVAAALARAGLPDSARAVARKARAMDPDYPWAVYGQAYVYLQLGDRDRALQLLSRYLELSPERRSYTAKDWWWKPLHSDPRFQALIDTTRASH